MTDTTADAVVAEIAAFREKHRWAIPEGTCEATRRMHPPEDILERLRERHSWEEVPPCRVCGGELTPQSVGGGSATTYAHSYPTGASFDSWSEHYTASKWTMKRDGDSEVIALIDLVEKLAATATTKDSAASQNDESGA